MKIRSNQTGFTMVELMIATTVFATVLVVLSVGVISMSNSYYKGINTSATQNVANNILNTVSQALQLSSGNLSFQKDSTRGLQVLCAGNLEFISLPGSLVQRGDDTQPVTVNSVGVYQKPAPPVCDDPTTITDDNLPSPNGQEILADNMRLLKLNVHSINGSTDCDPGAAGYSSQALCVVEVAVAFGNGDDLFCDHSLNGTGLQGSCDPGSGPFTSVLTLANDVQHNASADIRCRSQTSSRFCAVASLSTVVQRRL